MINLLETLRLILPRYHKNYNQNYFKGQTPVHFPQSMLPQVTIVDLEKEKKYWQPQKCLFL